MRERQKRLEELNRLKEIEKENGSNISEESRREKIITLFEAGFSRLQISEKVPAPYSTVKRVVAHYLESGTCTRKRGSGRPKLLDDSDREFLADNLRKNGKVSANK